MTLAERRPFCTTGRMDRRLFLLGAAALAGCSPAAGDLSIACDPDLVMRLKAAMTAWRPAGAATGVHGKSIVGLDDRALLAFGETTDGLVLVTREPKLADRLQRTSRVRLQNRWKPKIGPGEVQVVVTRGDGEAQGVAFARWLMTDEAAAILTRP